MTSNIRFRRGVYRGMERKMETTTWFRAEQSVLWDHDLFPFLCLKGGPIQSLNVGPAKYRPDNVEV